MALTVLPGTRPDLVGALATLHESRFLSALAINRLEAELRPDEQVVALVTGADGRMTRAFSALLVATTLRVLVISPRPMSNTCDMAGAALDKVTSLARTRQGLNAPVGTPRNVALRLTLQGRNLDLGGVDAKDADVFIRAVQDLQVRSAAAERQIPPPPSTPPAVPPPTTSSRVDQLSQLAALLEKGLITPEEFIAEKGRVLST